MTLSCAHTGSYPRIGEGREMQRLRRAYGQHERGDISEDEFEAVQRDTVSAVVSEQVAAGLDVVTDGQIRWYDPISHVPSRLEGVEINGLLRYFDTNFYFRQPVTRGRPRWRAPVVAPEYRFAASVSPKPVKAVLTGPYTLARLSIPANGASVPQLAEAYTEVIAAEVAALAEAGAQLIQIDEPMLLKAASDLPLVRQALERLDQARGAARLALYTYFGDVRPLYDSLVSLPVAVLGLDFTYCPLLVDQIAAAGSPRSLGLGLIDGRNTRLEQDNDILRALDRIVPRVTAGEVYLNPSCGLEYLPRDKAQDKLRHLCRLARQWQSGGRT